VHELAQLVDLALATDEAVRFMGQVYRDVRSLGSGVFA
jgi:hypothetical protein